MQISNDDLAQFKELCRKEGFKEMSDDQAHETLASLLLLFERFSLWVAQEKAKGRVFEIGDPTQPSKS